jgi:hypothetical protein
MKRPCVAQIDQAFTKATAATPHEKAACAVPNTNIAGLDSVLRYGDIPELSVSVPVTVSPLLKASAMDEIAEYLILQTGMRQNIVEFHNKILSSRETERSL